MRPLYIPHSPLGTGIICCASRCPGRSLLARKVTLKQHSAASSLHLSQCSAYARRCLHPRGVNGKTDQQLLCSLHILLASQRQPKCSRQDLATNVEQAEGAPLPGHCGQIPGIGGLPTELQARCVDKEHANEPLLRVHVELTTEGPEDGDPADVLSSQVPAKSPS
eukprot:CAMPEP_0170640878 /NCGR_PEP_ID=MMETSP0224-20130122/40466_1 /TAXON_ID=285029 /ORGANISM="Togula jolla, Strain CCCM 725" /LENGTH=164 /DNA_ID=CAMNT_0010971427 /DNA_START=39 /DNA_END=529 /DNA_ORIENTATION=-